jgi:hypothetical protein
VASACIAPLRARLPLARLDSFRGKLSLPFHKAAAGDFHTCAGVTLRVKAGSAIPIKGVTAPQP